MLRYKASAPKAEGLAALKRLQTVLFEVLTIPNELKTPLDPLRGKALKAEEDFLNAPVCAYTLYHCTENTCLCFGNDAVDNLVTPVPGR